LPGFFPYFYWDKAKKNLAKNLAGGYLSTAESKIAPLLVSGHTNLPARFRYKYLKTMPENEASEVLFKYSRFFDVPVTEEKRRGQVIYFGGASSVLPASRITLDLMPSGKSLKGSGFPHF
jgi:hypothetical protein